MQRYSENCVRPAHASRGLAGNAGLGGAGLARTGGAGEAGVGAATMVGCRGGSCVCGSGAFGGVESLIDAGAGAGVGAGALTMDGLLGAINAAGNSSHAGSPERHPP